MPMRVLAVVTLLILLLEVALGLAFLAGYHWVGGWDMGVLFAAALLLLLLLPWIGTLEASYDSAAQRASARLSWWGAVRVQMKPQRELQLRVLGIPWRKRFEEKKPREALESEEAVEPDRAEREQAPRRRAGRAGLGPDQMARLVPAALQALSDLLCEAREVKITVHSPTGSELADSALAAVVGHRGLGPLDLYCTTKGNRRVRVHYRIGMLRAGLAALYLAIQARPLELAARARAARKADEETAQAPRQ